MEVLDTTVANVSLHHIAGSLSISADESTYVLTSYLVANAIVVPISGWLATRLGRKRFYLICITLFTVSSALCATATTLGQMLVWRVAQGLGGGGLAPVEQSIFADTFPIRQRPQAFALYGLTVVMAPAIGPVLGGWLTDTYSWHWVFLINLPIGCVSLVLCALLVHDSPALQRERARQLASGLSADWFGFALVAIGFGSLQIVLDRFEREGGIGSPLVNGLGSLAIVSLLILVIWEYHHPQPVMDVRLLRKPGFGVACLLMFGVGFALLSSSQILPQMTQSLMGYDAVTAGLTLGAAGLVTILMMPLSGLLTSRIQPRFMACLAFGGTAFAMYYATGFTPQTDFDTLSISRVLLALALPFLFIPITSASLAHIPPAQNGQASAFINLSRNLGGSTGISYTTTLFAYREQFHHARLAEHITPYAGYTPGHALAAIAARVETQAAMLSYLDLYWALMVAALCFAPLALLLPKLPKGAAAAH